MIAFEWYADDHLEPQYQPFELKLEWLVFFYLHISDEHILLF